MLSSKDYERMLSLPQVWDENEETIRMKIAKQGLPRRYRGRKPYGIAIILKAAYWFRPAGIGDENVAGANPARGQSNVCPQV